MTAGACITYYTCGSQAIVSRRPRKANRQTDGQTDRQANRQVDPDSVSGVSFGPKSGTGTLSEPHSMTHDKENRQTWCR